jgi:ergothioneine biosynthesis protein EgtB
MNANVPRPTVDRGGLWERYARTRAATEEICAPLATDDYQIQSILETSPPKWHLAHVSWFFETFLLGEFLPGYRVFDPRYAFLFNSYYLSLGNMQPRARRGDLSRPTVEEVYAYRRHVDEAMALLVASPPPEHVRAIAARTVLGLHHEEQHQELLLMDIKHNFSVNPLHPAYRGDLALPAPAPKELGWLDCAGEEASVGHAGDGFCFDNERPRHRVLLSPHRLASRLVTNGEYLAFIEDDGYRRPELWLADGWATVQSRGWQAPLYWERQDGEWWQFTLGGRRPLAAGEPVCHVGFYEADAYARWRGKRLPTEFELEAKLAGEPVAGNFLDSDLLHPRGGEQWFGDLWQWTASPYVGYPGFRPLPGSIGEYNGKFMCNQWVLRGGCCATPAGHTRATYRNFFFPHDRWQFAGIRLAEDA